MAIYTTTDTELTAEADAIREMTGQTEELQYKAGAGFAEEILKIATPPIKNVQGTAAIVVPAQGVGVVGVLPVATIQNVTASAQIVEA